MKNISQKLSIATLAILSVSCSSDSIVEEQKENEKVFIEFSANVPEEATTRASFADLSGTSYAVTWKVGDALTAFSTELANSSTPQPLSVTKVYEKSAPGGGKIKNSAKIAGELNRSTKGYNITYPSSCNPTYVADKKVNLVIPSVQTGVKGNCNESAMLLYGHANPNTTMLTMYHVCAYFYFNVTSDNIKSIKLETSNGYAISGELWVESGDSGINSGSIEGTSGKSSVELKPSGTVFETGEYVMAVRPGNYASNDAYLKITITYSDNTTKVQKTTSLVDVKSAWLYNLGEW